MSFFEQLLFEPKGFWQNLLVFLLAPFGKIYCFVSRRQILQKVPANQGIAVVSIGNLLVGGMGKTPLTIALVKRYPKSAVVLRGYKRETKGLLVLSDQMSVKESGDEAKLYKNELADHTVIVSEDRIEGIKKAKELGASVVFLDDGFRHQQIEKFDILIRGKSDPKNSRCLPAGAYRQPPQMYDMADFVAIEDRDFFRSVTIENQSKKMVLVTAIARASRLDQYLPDLEAKYIYPDHYHFTQEEIEQIVDRHKPTSLLVTTKDAVKLSDFGLNLSILKLDITLSDKLLSAVDSYINSQADSR